MLSCEKVSARQAVGYYRSEDEAQAQGQWWGKGAETLKLSGDVQQQPFRDVLYGWAPGKPYRLRQSKPSHLTTTPTKQKKQTMEIAAVDVTCSAPKSVTIAALVYGDARVIEAHQAAVLGTLQRIQGGLISTRYKVNGRRQPVTTDNLIAAVFLHRTSRCGDPQLHSHALVMNATMGLDDKWRAMLNKGIYTNQAQLGIQYRKQLAKSLQNLDYQIAWKDPQFFEIAKVHPSLIQEFSTRRKQVLEAALSDTTRARQIAALKTRQPKPKVDPSVELRDAQLSKAIQELAWQERAKKAYQQWIQQEQIQGQRQGQQPRIRRR